MGPDLTVWNFWWGFNRDRFIRPSPRPRVLSDEDRQQVRLALREAMDRKVVEPQLHAACLIGLAKIGGAPPSGAGVALLPLLRSHASHPSRVVAEAATMALGILGDDRAIPFLRGLVLDEEGARQELGLATVPFRIRTFAAYSLGLIAHAASDDAPRRVVAELLVDVLESPQFPTRDLKIACVQAFGLCALESSVGVSDPRDLPGNLRHVVDREAQIAFLIDYCSPATRQTRRHRHYLVAAHAPAAMARLIRSGRGVAETSRVDAADALLALIDPQAHTQREVTWGALQALGTIGTASGAGGAEGADNRIREALVNYTKTVDPMGRRFALISLAQSGGRPGPGQEGAAGTAFVTRELRRQLVRGKSQLQPWAGLAMGVLNHQLQENGVPARLGLEDAQEILFAKAESCKQPQDIGAYLLGLALCGHSAAAEELAMVQLHHFRGDAEAQGTCAVAVGLLGDRAAVPELRGSLGAREHRADLALHSAQAFGLLGDRESLLAVFEIHPRTQVMGEVAGALGRTRDRLAIGPLLAMLREDSTTAVTRAFSAAALGELCGRDVAPWNAPYAVGLNYRACPTTMTDPNSHGLLDIL